MYKYLDNIKSNQDLRDLPLRSMPELCGEIRAFLVDKISKTGGHLASNLGIVELTVALHRVYDPDKDRIVFDVGHQCYVHKLLTGRREGFDRLRQYEGLSGFPRTYESEADAFIGGHASNSISAALGMAKARTLLKEEYSVAAVIGDGSFTGGLAYEGLSNAAGSREPMVIILNDNKMSISPNVGGISESLQRLRVAPKYLDLKERYKNAVSGLPLIYKVTHSVKERIKSEILPENMFTEMGITYMGPVDGHNVAELENALRWAKDAGKPVVVHVVTVKGKGVSYAEASPDIYHGVGPFDPKTGALPPAKLSYSSVFGRILTEYAQKDPKIVAVTAAMLSGTGLERFAKTFPDRIFDVGIAEGHAVTMCGGMAKQGLIPVFVVYSTFLQRSYDMLIHDVALSRLHVIICVDRAGLVGNDGETHQGTFDLAYLRSVPGMTIFCPSNYGELKTMLWEAIYRTEGPVAVRYPRGEEGSFRDVYSARETMLRSGTDVTLAVYGDMVNEAILAVDTLGDDITVDLIKIGRIDHEPYERCLESLRRTGKLVVAEDVCANNCLGETLLMQCAGNGIAVKAQLLNSGDGVVPHGSVGELRKALGIDAEGIRTAVLGLAGERNG